MNNNQPNSVIDVYSLVTNRIITLLEAGTVPWRKPWTARGIPRNAQSKRPYQGINIILLNSLNFKHNLFLTWNQIKDMNASVLKGEKGQFIIFTKKIEVNVEKNGMSETAQKSMLRYYTVWNIAQCKDLPLDIIPSGDEDLSPIPSCTSIIEGMKHAPKIVHKKTSPFYYPPEDYINMPKISRFKKREEYYGALFHELIHSTGHQSRLSRKEVFGNPDYGTEPYSMEELVGEIGACFLKSHAGLNIEDMSNNVSYINSWLVALRGDKKILIQAASRAQKAVEYILYLTEPEAASQEKEGELEIGLAA